MLKTVHNTSVSPTYSRCRMAVRQEAVVTNRGLLAIDLPHVIHDRALSRVRTNVPPDAQIVRDSSDSLPLKTQQSRAWVASANRSVIPAT